VPASTKPGVQTPVPHTKIKDSKSKWQEFFVLTFFVSHNKKFVIFEEVGCIKLQNFVH
jgi:hypothetical protein